MPMDRPEDVPEWAWGEATAEALKFVEWLDPKPTEYEQSEHVLAVSFALAILKAREEAFEEAISAASQKFFPGKVGVQGPSQEAIIQAIRQHSQKGER